MLVCGYGASKKGYDDLVIAGMLRFPNLLSILFLAAVIVNGVTPSFVIACPLIDGMVDFNCDGTMKVAVVGDSIVKGTGDLKFNNKGGYVARLQRTYRKSTFVNLGRPGYASDRLLSEFKLQLQMKGSNKTKRALSGSDIIIIDAGRNDFFAERETGLIVRDLKRLSELLRRSVGKLNGGPQPYMVIAALLPTTRGFQRAFIEELNTLLYERSAGDFPVLLEFNTISEEFISVDGIHPTSDGYKEMTDLAANVLIGGVRERMLVFRTDSDSDGIFDRFEKSRFGTDPSKKDSDADGLNDGEEVFDYSTDPLLPDSDNDGVTDGDEVMLGRNPLGID